MSTQPAAARILVIDDEVPIRRLLRVTLEGAGFEVHEAESGQLGVREVAYRSPDAIVLDLGLPDISGTEVLKRLREWSKVPVVVLSVRSSEDDKIEALELGADDYLTKPFSGRELIARVRAVLRRAQDEPESAVVRFGEIEVDQAARSVRRNGEEVHLTAKEYSLLRLLVQYRGKVVTHAQILREVWGPNAQENTHYLRVFMTHLRQKLERDPANPQHLKTDSGIGYRLME